MTIFFTYSLSKHINIVAIIVIIMYIIIVGIEEKKDSTLLPIVITMFFIVSEFSANTVFTFSDDMSMLYVFIMSFAKF